MASRIRPNVTKVCATCSKMFWTKRGNRKCSGCRLKDRNLRDPGAAARAQRLWRARNPEKLAEYQRRYYLKGPKKKLDIRDRRRVRNFGVSSEVMAAMLDWQGGACRICRRTFSEPKLPPAIDHDHSSGLVRGLLCHQCNLGLGNFRDNPAFLLAAIEYLRESSSVNSSGDQAGMTKQVTFLGGDIYHD